MKSLTRTIIVLVIINLTIGNFALAQNVTAEPERPTRRRVTASTTTEPPSAVALPEPIPVATPVVPIQPALPAPRPTFTISGRTGLSGVEMQGLPGNPVFTDENGFYSAKVPYGWTGVVRPKKDGFKFEPPEYRYSRTTNAVTNCDYSPRKFGPMPMFSRTGSREVLVIPATKVEAENLVAITEDLQVMSHIFDERFKEPREIRGVFVDFGDFFGRDSRSTEAIYIQGYGVLFLMEVNFTFSPEPEPQEQEAQETEEYIDPDWQRAKQKLFSPPGFGGRDFAPEEQYSAQQVDQIKTELIRTLKHTANIRNLQPDERIILTVIGQNRQSGGMYEDYYRNAAPRSGLSRSRRRSSSSSRGGFGGGGFGGGGMGGGMGGMMGGGIGGGVMMGGGMDSRMGGGMDSRMGGMGGGMYGEMEYGSSGMEYGETGPASTTVLTIRAKKSDVDAFAIGKLDFEEFQEKVDIFTY